MCVRSGGFSAADNEEQQLKRARDFGGAGEGEKVTSGWSPGSLRPLAFLLGGSFTIQLGGGGEKRSGLQCSIWFCSGK